MTEKSKRATVRKNVAALRHVRTGPVSDKEASDRRDRVLAIAGEEFLANGYRGASLDVISRRSQVSKATLYREFGAKDKLFRAFIMANIKGYSGQIARVIGSNRAPGDVLRSIVQLSIRAVIDEKNLGILTLAIAERARFPIVSQMLLNEMSRIRKPIADYLMKLSDILDEKEADRQAFHLMNMAVGGFSPLLVGKHSANDYDDGWVDSVVDVFLTRFPLKEGVENRA